MSYADQDRSDAGSTRDVSTDDVTTEVLRPRGDDLIDGKYRLIERLGIGGMGEVYKAEHVHLGTTRVIKVMRPQLAGDKEHQDRFLREAQLATRIQSPNVATLHDFSTLPDGSCYMVWELIEGTDVSTFLKGEGPLSPEFAIRLVIRALAGLGAVHSAGIVHRDVSPQNLMVHVDQATGELDVKVIDLGIARSDEGDSSLTRTGMFVGKWRYASPEHLGLIDANQKIDGRADLFSMGIVLYELLTGRTPFNADTPGQYVLLHAADRPSPVSLDTLSIPSAPGIEAVLAKALARNRDDRFETANEFIAALEGVLDHMEAPDDAPTMILTPSPHASVRTEPRSRRIPKSEEVTVRTQSPIENQTTRRPTTIVAVAAAAVLSLAIGGGIIYFEHSPEGEPSPETVAAVSTQPDELATPSGETVEVEAENVPVAPKDVSAPPVRTVEPPQSQAPAPKSRPVVSPEVTVPTPTVKAQEPARAAEDVIPPAPVIEASDTIPGVGHPLFGRRSKRFVDSPEYAAGFRSGIIRDYGDMWSRGGCDWASVAEHVRLSDYAISISPLRNLTSVEDEQIRYWLEGQLQEELDGIAGDKGKATAESAVFWASTGRDAGIGIEMIFHDSSGRVIAKIRHTIREDSVADAAEEMVEAVTDFVEDHEVVRRKE